MNKNKYTFEPIKIEVKNLKEYTDIAFVIDRPLFIREAKKIRKKYGITKPLKDGNYQHWLMTNLGKKNIPIFYKEIKDLRLFLGFNPNYQTVFENAVLGYDITDGDYRTTRLINFSKLPDFLEDDSTTAWAILVTPQTKKKDVVRVFNYFEKIIKDMQKSPDTFSLKDKYDKRRNEIDRDRRRYWQKKQGLSYKQIAKWEEQNDKNSYLPEKDSVVKAIKAYKEKLL